MTLVQEKVAEFSATMHVSSGSASGGSSAAPRKVKKVVSNGDEDDEVEESVSDDSRQLQRGFSKVSVQNILEVERFTTKIKENMPSMNDALKCMTEMMELGRQDRLSIAEDKKRLNDIEIKCKRDQIEIDNKGKRDQIELDRQAANLAAEKMQRQNELDEEATVIKERRNEIDKKAKMELIDIDIKGKNVQIEQERQVIENRKRMLELEREELELSEIKRKRASPQEPVNEQKAGSITIRDVAEEHPELFVGMDKKEYDDILMKAGGICAKAYKKAGKKPLPKVPHGRFDVALYNPEDKETFILPALKKALTNNNIKPITKFFERRAD